MKSNDHLSPKQRCSRRTLAGRLIILVSGLREKVEDVASEAALEAATKSRRIVTTARSRLSEADGTAERAQLEHAEKMRAIL